MPFIFLQQNHQAGDFSLFVTSEKDDALFQLIHMLFVLALRKLQHQFWKAF